MPIPDSDPIVTIPVATPLDEQDRVDLDALARNVERWLKTPAAGFTVGTATGEEWFLGESEKYDMVRTLWRHWKARCATPVCYETTLLCQPNLGERGKQLCRNDVDIHVLCTTIEFH